MRSLSLFAGVGRADAALEALGVETVAFSEVEEYPRAVMRKRFPNALDLGDIRGITRDSVPVGVEVMSGGFPCQDISNAGKRAGMSGDRSSLWGEYARLIGIFWPSLVFIENVSALLGRGLDVVLRDLYDLGYAAEWDCIPAAAVGAPHLRDRIWMVAYPDSREPLYVFGEERLEKSLATLEHPPSKFPRSGRMDQAALYVNDPVARRKTKRLNPGSAWVGARLTDTAGWWHARPVFPTPVARDWKGSGFEGQLGTVAARGLWPTPRASWNENRTTKRAPSHGDGHGLLLAAEANEADAAEGKPRGTLNADWVEWLMGMPVGWTDLDVENPVAHSWDDEPAGLPRVTEGQPKRRERLTACGNALVSQVQGWVAARALERLS